MYGSEYTCHATRCTVVMSMFVSSKWKGVRALFYCYLTFLDHRTNNSRKVRAPRRVSASGAPNKFQNFHLDETNMDKTSQHRLIWLVWKGQDWKWYLYYLFLIFLEICRESLRTIVHIWRSISVIPGISQMFWYKTLQNFNMASKNWNSKKKLKTSRYFFSCPDQSM